MNRSDPIFVFDESSSPLGHATREELFTSLRSQLKSKVKAAYVFGSIARNAAKAGSDVDLILVADSSRPFVDRFKDFMFLFDAPYKLDLLIYTEAEFNRLMADPSPGIWRDIKRDAVRVM